MQINRKVRCDAINRHSTIEGINGKKSSGPDEISPRILKEVRVEIAPILTFIVNQSHQQGCLPTDWLTANVFALHKKGSKTNPENYRPISLTSVCCKILEHIIYSAVSRFFWKIIVLSLLDSTDSSQDTHVKRN